MKSNFAPRLLYDAGLVSGIAQGVIGGIQAIAGGSQQAKAMRKAEKLINNYQPNSSIMDYYSKALQRYSSNPYTSQSYNFNKQMIGANTANAINAYQDRRSANANIGTLIQGQNDALLKAAANAEDREAQTFAQLGGATDMKAREDKYKFENMVNLLTAKASGGTNIMNAGLGNVGGALNSISQMEMLKKYYGKEK